MKAGNVIPEDVEDQWCGKFHGQGELNEISPSKRAVILPLTDRSDSIQRAVYIAEKLGATCISVQPVPPDLCYSLG